MMRCLEEYGKQWRPVQGKLGWEKQKKEEKKKEAERRREEKKQKKEKEKEHRIKVRKVACYGALQT